MQGVFLCTTRTVSSCILVINTQLEAYHIFSYWTGKQQLLTYSLSLLVWRWMN